MNRKTVETLLDIQERFYRDPDYPFLSEELQLRDRDFQQLMEVMPPQQRAIVDDYMGILHEMQRKLLCYAVESTRFQR